MSATATYNNNNTWTCPATQYVTIEGWGGGGGGGSSNNTSVAATGGGGGAYARKRILVQKDEVLTLVVGVGGANGTIGGWGTAGGNTYVTRSGGNDCLIWAAGGSGGEPGNYGSNATGGGYPGTGGLTKWGDVAFTGGNGVKGNNSNGVGGGGGAAGGNSANGNAGTIPTGGVGQGGGGNGGTGGANNTNATDNATEPGGGGGGSGKKVTAHYGMPGKVGAVKITYDSAVNISGKVTLSGANVSGAKVVVVASDDNNSNNSFTVAVATSNATGDWAAVAPGNHVISAYAQHNNGTQYTSKATPFIAS